MRDHGIGTICTHDVAGFAGVDGIETITPDALLAAG
jgi:hypothetical protein